MSSKPCRIRFRSGELISAMVEVTCDDEASCICKERYGVPGFTVRGQIRSVANKTKRDNQGLGVAVFVRLTGNTPQKSGNNIAFARRTAIQMTGVMISPVGVKGQPRPLSIADTSDIPG